VNRRLILILGVILIAIVLSIALIIKKSVGLSKDKTNKINSISNLLTTARDAELKGNLLGAKTAYQKLVNNFSNSNEIMNWQKKIEELNIKILFSPTITPKSVPYTIKPGDTLAKIAKEFNTTVELLKKSNNLADDKILPGKKIKVWTGHFSILVYKSQNILILKSDEEIIKTYVVSTGANNHTPVGTFKIVEKLINPTWFKAGAVVPPNSPENVLGTRWLGFDLTGYGIHGTTDPQSLGKQVTQGCVRMSNPEVEELYTIVPRDTEVTIVD